MKETYIPMAVPSRKFINVCFLVKSLVILLAMLLYSFHSYAQSGIDVTGKIVDETGETVIGASVRIKDTTTGTITDIDGAFKLSVPNTTSVLQISYLGYQSQNVTVGNQTSLFIRLEPAASDIDEVIVIGYGTVRKRDLTGSVGSIRSTDIVAVPTSNALGAIQGKIAGVDIMRESGIAGAPVNIKVRGSRSINAGSSPLFIIDGMQGGSFEDINPGDIESIEVLKDASSTAIYGSQGANGVIIITTKKGGEGRTHVTYDGYYGVSNIAKYPKPLKGNAYLKMRRDAGANAGTWSSVDDDINIFSNDELNAIGRGEWVDWIDEVSEAGSQQSHQISIRGGNSKTRSFASFSFHNEKGMFLNDKSKRYTLRINIDHAINKWVKTGVSSQFTYWNRNDRKSWVLTNANQAMPLGIPYDENGKIVLRPMPTQSEKNLSPLADNIAGKAVDNTLKSHINMNGFVDVSPLEWISFRTQVGVNVNFQRNGIFNHKESIAQYSNPINQAEIHNSNSRHFNWDNVITVKKRISEHSFNFTALTSYTKMESDLSSMTGYKQISANAEFYNMSGTESTSRELYSAYSDKTTMSYAGRLHYSFKDRYLLTASVRADGSSRLAQNNRWHTFPSVAAAWRIVDEDFMKNLTFVDEMKLRLSYGTTGNSDIGDSETKTRLVPGDKMGFGEIAGQTFKYASYLGNPNIAWEKSNTFDIGLDLNVVKNRIRLNFDYYLTKTTDILLERRLPSSAGGDGKEPFRMWQNVGETESKGVEITLNTINFESKVGFNWSSAITFTANEDKIVKMYGGDLVGATEEASKLMGRPLNIYYGFKKLGIWQLSEAEEAARYHHGGVAFKPGDIKIQNVLDEKGKEYEIDQKNDWTYLGQQDPKWTLGFNNNFAYKGFDMNVYMYIRWGHMIDYALAGRYNPTGSEGQPGNYNYWTPDNPSNDYPAADINTPLINYFGYTSLRYIDASYFKIKTLTLGYTLPKKVTQKAWVEKMRVYCTANNIFTKAKSDLLKDYDPERGGAETYPMSRQFIFGLTLDF